MDIKSRLEQIATTHNCTLTFDHPYVDDDEAACAGNDEIFIGKFSNQDYMIAAFFHELGHCLSKIEYKPHLQTIYYELEAWALGFDYMEKYNFILSFDMVQYCLSKLSTYINHDWTELTWEGCLKLLLAIKKPNK